MGKRIDELTAYTDPALEDLLVMVDDPSSSHVTRKVTLQDVRDAIRDTPTTTNAQGDVYYYGGTEIEALTVGTKGKALTTGGASADPSWEGMTTSGDTEYHNGTTRARLPKGSNTNLLTLTAGIPAWIAASSSVVFASGTKMLFYQDTAPTGWTIQNTLDDKVVYITKGSAASGQTGGGTHSTGSWTISGLTDSGHTHTGPSHTHDINESGELDGTAMSAGGGNYDMPHYGATAQPWLTGVSGTGTTASGTATITSAGTWRPAAYCCIICEKT